MMVPDIDTNSDVIVKRETLSTASLLTGGLAHEINNGLVALLDHLALLTELLPAGASSEARGELAGAHEAARHIAAVVRDVQALLRAERRESLIDPREAVERAVRLARPRAMGVAHLHADLEQVPRVHGSDVSLTQIALNLVLNALEACRAGAPRSGHVDVTLYRDGDAIALEVCDDGIGMDAELAERAFRPLVSRKADAPSGLGLAITCHLVAAMRGVIEFDSQSGIGTSFRVRLPGAGELP